MERTTCNLCNGTDYLERFTVPDLLLDRKEIKATFVQCTSCGLIYQNPRPGQEEIADHYPPEYDSYNNGVDSASFLQNAVFSYGINKRRRFVTRVKNEGRLLDIGCATGQFLRGMQRYPDFELVGVEIDHDAAHIAQSQYGLNVFNGRLEEAGFPDAHFDAVTLWDVLEHLPDPSASLMEIHRILKPDGILVLRVPNAGSWDARIFGKFWAGVDAPRHLYIFDRRTLAALLKKTGFKILRTNGNLGSYNSVVISLRFWLASKNVANKNRQRMEKILVHPIARLISAPFFFFLGFGTRGPFLIVTAAKK